MTDADVSRMASHVGLSEAGFRSRYVTGVGQLKQGLGGRCVFLEDGREATCGVYPVRPEKCRTWPFWDELLESPENLSEAMRLCPGIQPK